MNEGGIQTGMAAGVAGVAQNTMQQYMNYQIMQKMGVTGGGSSGPTVDPWATPGGTATSAFGG